MKANQTDLIREKICNKARELGADLVGVADVEYLKSSPSHRIYLKIPAHQGVGVRKNGKSLDKDVIDWPQQAKSAVVIAVRHPQDRPELDYWDGRKGTPGNRILIGINKNLGAWIKEELGYNVWPLPYHVEKGGIFLKDAAVAAGIGAVGKNNLLVTEPFGPRVRLRCLLLDALLPPTGPVSFDPCAGCSAPCRSACPMSAFDEKIYMASDLGPVLPARDGVYSRSTCNMQMEIDIANGEEVAPSGDQGGFTRIRYCRRCETACLQGADSPAARIDISCAVS